MKNERQLVAHTSTFAYRQSKEKHSERANEIEQQEQSKQDENCALNVLEKKLTAKMEEMKNNVEKQLTELRAEHEEEKEDLIKTLKHENQNEMTKLKEQVKELVSSVNEKLISDVKKAEEKMNLHKSKVLLEALYDHLTVLAKSGTSVEGKHEVEGFVKVDDV